MTAVSDLAAHRQVNDQARADAIARHPAGKGMGTCPPHAALLHRVASLITTENLPPVHISIHGNDITLDASNGELVQNVVRRWAAALDLIVSEVPYDLPGGTAATLWSASGYDGTGVHWHVAGALPVQVRA